MQTPKTSPMRTSSKMPPGQKLGSLQQPKRPSSSFSLELFFKCFLCGVIFFYVGISVGWNMDRDCNCDVNKDSGNLRAGGAGNGGVTEIDSKEMAAALKRMEKLVEEHKVKEELWAVELANMKNRLEEHEESMKIPNTNDQEKESKELKELKKHLEAGKKNLVEKKEKLRDAEEKIKRLESKNVHNTDLFFGKHTGSFAMGMDFVDRTDFAKRFDSGVPLDGSGWANDQVVLLYSDNSAMPDKNATKKMQSNGVELYSVEDATKNCRNLHIIYTAESRHQQCVAIMAQYEAYHIQKFMRMADGERQSERVIDMNLPLRYVNRHMALNGEKSVSAPKQEVSKKFWKMLAPYLNSLEGVLEELSPIAKDVASNNAHNAIVVMVCNRGHSEMLMNFVCNAHAKGKDTEEALKSILIFATDNDTHMLAQSLGLKSFWSPTVFGGTPEAAAGKYGDDVYSEIMLTKVYCIHLISQLGYDLLFQDVDIVWYKNPLPFFYNDLPEKNFVANEWDMVYQDDGARTLFFSPYSANTGFYFVRNNRKTQNFFNQLLMSGDAILQTGSHQNVLIVMLAEHASLHAMRTKTWSRMEEEFPGGHAYHVRGDFMKKLVLSKNSTEGRGLIESAMDKEDAVDPYIFHMSWTEGKDNKLKFFEQLGEWYLKDECNVNSPKAQDNTLQNPTISSCCAVKPLMRCHFKDKPSMIPCKDFPSIDTRPKPKPSFW